MNSEKNRTQHLQQEVRNLLRQLEEKNGMVKQLQEDKIRLSCRVIFLQHLVAKMSPPLAAEFYRRALRELQEEGIKT